MVVRSADIIVSLVLGALGRRSTICILNGTLSLALTLRGNVSGVVRNIAVGRYR